MAPRTLQFPRPAVGRGASRLEGHTISWDHFRALHRPGARKGHCSLATLCPLQRAPILGAAAQGHHLESTAGPPASAVIGWPHPRRDRVPQVCPRSPRTSMARPGQAAPRGLHGLRVVQRLAGKRGGSKSAVHKS